MINRTWKRRELLSLAWLIALVAICVTLLPVPANAPAEASIIVPPAESPQVKGALAGWDNSFDFVIDSDLIDGNLTHFPVTLWINNYSGSNGADLTPVFDEVGSNFYKIAVADENDTEWYVEVEVWDADSEVAVLHCGKSGTVIPSGSDFTLTLYYDADHADNTSYVGLPNSVAAEGVWDSNFDAVWHFTGNETDYCSYDSTTNDYDLTESGNPRHGFYGDVGEHVECDGTGDYWNTSSAIDHNYITCEAYCRVDAAAIAGIVGNWQSGDTSDQSYLLRYSSADSQVRFYARKDAATSTYSQYSYTLGTTQYFAGRYDGSNAKLWVDSANVDTDAMAGTLETTGENVYIGAYNSATATTDMDGMISEIRISSIARADEWLKATYYSLTNTLGTWTVTQTSNTYEIRKLINGSGRADGTISVTNGSTAVTGSSTHFTDWLAGDKIELPDSNWYSISSITSDTSLTLTTNYTGSTLSGQSYDCKHINYPMRIDTAYNKSASALQPYGEVLESGGDAMPVIECGTGTDWDADTLTCGHIFEYGDYLYMIYTGANDTGDQSYFKNGLARIPVSNVDQAWTKITAGMDDGVMIQLTAELIADGYTAVNITSGYYDSDLGRYYAIGNIKKDNWNSIYVGYYYTDDTPDNWDSDSWTYGGEIIPDDYRTMYGNPSYLRVGGHHYMSVTNIINDSPFEAQIELLRSNNMLSQYEYLRTIVPCSTQAETPWQAQLAHDSELVMYGDQIACFFMGSPQVTYGQAGYDGVDGMTHMCVASAPQPNGDWTVAYMPFFYWSYDHKLGGACDVWEDSGNTLHMWLRCESADDGEDKVYKASVDRDLVIFFNGNCQADFGDVDVYASDRTTPLDYWLEDVVTGDFTPIWVEVDEIPSTGSQGSVWFSYGGRGQTSGANGTAVFDLFDDFANLDNWNTSGTTSVSGGYAVVGGSAGEDNIASKTAYGPGHGFMTKAYKTSGATPVVYVQAGNTTDFRNVYHTTEISTVKFLTNDVAASAADVETEYTRWAGEDGTPSFYDHEFVSQVDYGQDGTGNFTIARWDERDSSDVHTCDYTLKVRVTSADSGHKLLVDWAAVYKFNDDPPTWAAGITPPTVVIQAATDITSNSAILNANLTVLGDAGDPDWQGCAWSQSSQSTPGDVAPADSDYASYSTEAGRTGTGTFDVTASSLTAGTWYFRAYVYDSLSGWTWSTTELSFDVVSIRKNFGTTSGPIML